MSGAKISGFAFFSRTLKSSLLEREMWIDLPQCAQEVSTSAFTPVFHMRPSTKGVAIASIAQAAKLDSPLLKRTR